MKCLFEFIIKLNFWTVCQVHSINIMCHSYQRKISGKNRCKQQGSNEKERRVSRDQITQTMYKTMVLAGANRLSDVMRRRVIVLRNILRTEDYLCDASAYFSTVLERVGHAGFKTFPPQERAIFRMEVLNDKTRCSLHDNRVSTTCTHIREVDGIVRATTKKC